MPAGKRQIELTWRCSSCGHRNRGRDQLCQECRNPKDKSEKYEMPGETAAAATVTSPELLRMATAGPNWRCAYCGSDQRRNDNSCGECGAKAPVLTAAGGVVAAVGAVGLWARLRRRRRAVAAAVVVAVAGAIAGGVAWSRRTRRFDATVAAVQWEQAIVVERYQVWEREDWRQGLAAEAFEVVSLGDQVHHYDDVLDGYDTEYYTEQVSCGQDCTDVPESCSEHCSDNGNGFASCETTCTGGGQRCTTKYCSEQRSRQVPRYHKEPRYAEKVRYRIWDWGDDRRVSATGASTTDLRWPTEEARVGAGLPPKEQERERRSGRYVVTLRYGEQSRLAFEVTVEAFAGFPVGSAHRLELKRSVATVDGVRVTQTSAE